MDWYFDSRAVVYMDYMQKGTLHIYIGNILLIGYIIGSCIKFVYETDFRFRYFSVSKTN